MIEMSVIGKDDDGSRMSDEQPLLEGSGKEGFSEGGTEQRHINGAKTRAKANTLRLRKELSVLHGVGLLVADIIGSGIFLSPNSVIARTGSYGLSIIVWILSGVIAAGGALCYGELSTFVRKSGADYAYIQEAYSFKKKNKFVRTVGNLISFTYLWMNFLISDPMSLAISGLLAAEYLIKPFYLTCDPPMLLIKMLAIVLLGMLCINTIRKCLAVRIHMSWMSHFVHTQTHTNKTSLRSYHSSLSVALHAQVIKLYLGTYCMCVCAYAHS